MINKMRKDKIRSVFLLILLTIVAQYLCGCTFSRNTQVSEAVKLKAAADSSYRRQSYTDALQLYTSALDAAYGENDSRVYFSSLANIGTIHDILGDGGRAMVYYRKALTGMKKHGYADLEAKLLPAMVVCSVNRHNIDDARMYYAIQKESPLADSILNHYYMTLSRGLLTKAENHPAEAITLFHSLLAFTDSAALDDRFKIPLILELGHAWKDAGRPDSAMSYYRTASETSVKNNLTTYLSDCYQALSVASKASDNDSCAEEYDRQYRELYHSIYDMGRINDALTAFTDTESCHSANTISLLTDRIGSLWIIITTFALLTVTLAITLGRIRCITQSRQEAYIALVKRVNEFELKDIENDRLRNRLLSVVQSEENEENTEKNPLESETVDIKTEKLLKRISEIMNNPDFLFDPNFNLAILCREAQSNTKYVSNAINSTYHKNFRQLLNELRVKKAISRLNTSDCRIQDLASELGYGSPNNFILVFKSIVGMTPAAYRQTVNENRQ